MWTVNSLKKTLMLGKIKAKEEGGRGWNGWVTITVNMNLGKLWKIVRDRDKESWVLKNWCFWTAVLEKTLEKIPWTAKRFSQSILKEIKTDAEAETPIFWPPDAKNWLIIKDPAAGKDWRQEEKGTTGDWDSWMASLIQWTWVWASSGSWWQTGKPGVLQSMGSQRVGHEWEPKWTELRDREPGTLKSIGFQRVEYDWATEQQ